MAGTSHGNYLITLTPFLLFLTGGFQVNQNVIFGATNPVAEARDARSSAPKPSAVET